MLISVLEHAQSGGLLGPVAVEHHIEHGEALAEVVGGRFTGGFLDLGSGAGIPGLVLLSVWPEASGVLVESQRRRCAVLERAVRELGIEGRTGVACGRAEELAHQSDLREAQDLVVARAFGAPATTAECAVGFLRAGGMLVVSEPPGPADERRWPVEGLAKLGLEGPEIVRRRGGTFAVMWRSTATSQRWPRRTGIPGKRPLWG
jgi:16S rRNA (guanine527-N7)-methyltransferase